METNVNKSIWELPQEREAFSRVLEKIKWRHLSGIWQATNTPGTVVDSVTSIYIYWMIDEINRLWMNGRNNIQTDGIRVKKARKEGAYLYIFE